MANRRVLFIFFAIVVVVLILVLGWRRVGPNTYEAAFQSGGTVDLDLSIGGFEIRGDTENQIRVEIDPDDVRSAHSEIRVNGNRATVRVDGQPNNFHAIIYVPQQTHLRAHQNIGQLRVLNVEGDKDLGLNIGQIQVEVPESEQIKSVEAAVAIGSLRAGPWRTQQGGFFRSFRAGGHGTYTMNAHLDIGEIDIH